MTDRTSTAVERVCESRASSAVKEQSDGTVCLGRVLVGETAQARRSVRMSESALCAVVCVRSYLFPNHNPQFKET